MSTSNLTFVTNSSTWALLSPALNNDSARNSSTSSELRPSLSTGATSAPVNTCFSPTGFFAAARPSVAATRATSSAAFISAGASRALATASTSALTLATYASTSALLQPAPASKSTFRAGDHTSNAGAAPFVPPSLPRPRLRNGARSMRLAAARFWPFACSGSTRPAEGAPFGTKAAAVAAVAEATARLTIREARTMANVTWTLAYVRVAPLDLE
mmetsp:Transcript_92340/g.263770  ORF Transcript_92340/g.263770 Transcript_92340/m.263770 type:complete len:215 (+) Transcript_92340:252-896(+)